MQKTRSKLHFPSWRQWWSATKFFDMENLHAIQIQKLVWFIAFTKFVHSQVSFLDYK